MERMWYYAMPGGDKKGPVGEAEIKVLTAEGKVKPADLVWSEGMQNWTPLSQVSALGGTPETPPAESAAAVSPHVPTQPMPASIESAPASVMMPEGLTGWMGFVGVMLIVFGVLSCLSCFGIVTGVLMIIAGTSVMGAKNLLAGMNRVDPAMLPFFLKLKTFFLMSGVMYILSLVMTVVVLVFYFSIIVGAIAAASKGFGQ